MKGRTLGGNIVEESVLCCSVALDTQPHAGEASTLMLANLANMAAREVEAPLLAQASPVEVYMNGICIPPLFRKIIDNYIWVVFTIDTNQPKWPILYVNQAFNSMTGETRECCCDWSGCIVQKTC